MAYLALSSDLHGYLFSIDHNGDLYRNRQVNPGHGPLVFPGLGERIGSGWDGVEHLGATRAADPGATLATNQLILVGVRRGVDGKRGEVVFAHTDVSNIDRWLGVSPLVDAGLENWPDLILLCAGRGGSLYGVDKAGTLKRRTYAVTLGPEHTPIVRPEAMTQLGTQWGTESNKRLSLLTNGNRFFDVTLDGELRYQQSTLHMDMTDTGWTVLSRGWTGYQRVLAGSPTSLYALGTEGALFVRRFADETNNTVRLLAGARDEKIGSGIMAWPSLPCAVEGYATPQSAAIGETIQFHTASRALFSEVVESNEFRVEYVKLRRMEAGKTVKHDKCIGGVDEPLHARQGTIPEDWLVKGAQWPTTFEFEILPHTPSGLYAARCEDSYGNHFFIPFVVRPAANDVPAPFAVLANTNTWNAYNCWGGYGKYFHHYPLPHTIPFERPHPGLAPDIPQGQPYTNGGAELVNQSGHLLRAELWVLGWLDGLDVTHRYDLFTDLDFHIGFDGFTNPDPSKRYKALILTVHPEYWTTEMYDRAKAYQELGGSIVYLGGNGIYEQVIFEPNGVGLQIFPGVDWSKIPPCATNEDVRVQCLLRVHGRPERALIGVGFENIDGVQTAGQPYALQLSPDQSPALKGLDLEAGGMLGATSANPGHAADGWEVDVRGPLTPPEAYDATALLAIGAYCTGTSGEMLFYRTPQGGFVFAGSSLDFGGSLAVDTDLQMIVKNVLDLCLEPRAGSG